MKNLFKGLILFILMILLAGVQAVAGTGSDLDGKWTAWVEGDHIVFKFRADWNDGRW